MVTMRKMGGNKPQATHELHSSKFAATLRTMTISQRRHRCSRSCFAARGAEGHLKLLLMSLLTQKQFSRRRKTLQETLLTKSFLETINLRASIQEHLVAQKNSI